MKQSIALFFPLLALIVAGCLATESTEYKIKLNDDGKSGSIITVMQNIQSDETDPAKQQKDFAQAIQSWKGDEYLLERIHDGLYVKNRSLSVEDNVLVWKEEAIFSDLGDIFKHDVHNDTLKILVKGDQKIVTTNGTVIPAKDSTIVLWSLQKTKELHLKTKENNFTPKSDFVAKFKSFMSGPK